MEATTPRAYSPPLLIGILLVGAAVSLPVAYHCVWALGFQFDEAPTRVAAHSLLGCFFYGAFTAKMLYLRVGSLPGMLLPVVGGAVFSSVIAIWFLTSFWFFGEFGFPQF